MEDVGRVEVEEEVSELAPTPPLPTSTTLTTTISLSLIPTSSKVLLPSSTAVVVLPLIENDIVCESLDSRLSNDGAISAKKLNNVVVDKVIMSETVEEVFIRLMLMEVIVVSKEEERRGNIKVRISICILICNTVFARRTF